LSELRKSSAPALRAGAGAGVDEILNIGEVPGFDPAIRTTPPNYKHNINHQDHLPYLKLSKFHKI
jgi:hypothetical protein